MVGCIRTAAVRRYQQLLPPLLIATFIATCCIPFLPYPQRTGRKSLSNPNERQPCPSSRVVATHSHRETKGSMTSLSIYDATAAQLARLPVEVLRLHLSQRNLVSTGPRDALAKRLHGHLRSEGKRPARPRPDSSRSGCTKD